MRKGSILLAALLAAAPAMAQQAAPPASVDFATAIKGQHRVIRGNLAKSAEKMAEADYAFKPSGVAPEVRTFGQLIIHLANANNNFCARAKGETPKPGLDEKATTSKADIVKALNEALTLCDGVYESLTDATIVEKISVTGRNNVKLERARGSGLISNLAHNNEHYGNIVTYMRAKGLVPPSSEGQ